MRKVVDRGEAPPWTLVYEYRTKNAERSSMHGGMGHEHGLAGSPTHNPIFKSYINVRFGSNQLAWITWTRMVYEMPPHWSYQGLMKNTKTKGLSWESSFVFQVKFSCLPRQKGVLFSAEKKQNSLWLKRSHLLLNCLWLYLWRCCRARTAHIYQGTDLRLIFFSYAKKMY